MSLARTYQRSHFVGCFRVRGLVLEVVRTAVGRDLFEVEVAWTIVAEQLAIERRDRH